jgi:hypothetical protein
VERARRVVRGHGRAIIGGQGGLDERDHQGIGGFKKIIWDEPLGPIRSQRRQTGPCVRPEQAGVHPGAAQLDVKGVGALEGRGRDVRPRKLKERSAVRRRDHGLRAGRGRDAEHTLGAMRSGLAHEDVEVAYVAAARLETHLVGL